VCLAIPGRVVELLEHPAFAKVEVGGVRRNINIGLIEGSVAPGDWVLLHVGFALSKIGEDEAREQMRMLQAMGEDELAIEEVSGYTFAAGAEPRGAPAQA
jgi:hydrogenase expression/formation protein HypC